MNDTARAALVLFCAFLLSAPLAGCGSAPQEAPASSEAAAETTAETAASLPGTAAATTAPAAPEAGAGYCSVKSLVVRGGPGMGYCGIGGLKYGEQMEILGREGDWFRIAFKPAPGGVGYVSAQYIQGEEPAPTTAPISGAPEAGGASDAG